MAVKSAALLRPFSGFWSRPSLSRRIAITTAVLIAGTAIVEGFLLIGVSSQVVRQLESDRVEQKVKSSAGQLASRIQDFRRVPLILSGTPPIERIAVLARGGEPQPGQSLEIWRQRLAIIFRSMMQADPSLEQVRLIGVEDGGREIVRVNRSPAGIQIVPDADLQRKGARAYLRRSIGLRAGEVYISTFDANVENGVVQRPFVPMLRAATPIYAPSGEIFGAIVVNARPDIWMNQMSVLGGFTAQFFRRLMLVNKDGDYVYRSDGGPIFGSFMQAGPHFRADWPQLSDLFSLSKASKLTTYGDGHVVAAARVQYDPADPSKFVILAADADASAVYGDTSRLMALGGLVALALCIIGLLAAFFVTRPLRGLMTAARRIAAGNVDIATLDKDDPDPVIGELGEALRVMKEALEKRDRSLRNSEAHLRAIVDNIIDGLITIDSNGRIRSFNPACEEIFGYKPSEALGRNVSMLMPRSDAAQHDTYMQNYARTGEARFMGARREVKGRHKSGRLIDLEVSVSQIRVDNEVLFSGAIRDITERKQIDRLKSEFISTVSHELRTPLTSILGSLSLLRSGTLGEISAKAERMIALAHANGGRLSALINDILDVEKIEAGAMEFKQTPEELRDVIDQAVEHMSGFAKPAGVAIETADIAPDIMLDTDRDRLLQVFANLLSNAVKFSPRGGTVSVDATMRGDKVRVSVSDQGPGIPEEFQARIFQKFAQADASDSRQKGGTGLGLNICKSIVERLGGEIGFKSEAGVGTTFYFDLPARRVGPVFSDIKRSA